ncbi:sensor histidine kinase [Kitasatospora sp. NPDC088134]|uniref:sensor histidine kinase n=1 Tax=Kitasatospora sp. NPDC088134 TaxID=3364071 RepID=UPI0038199596
MSEPHDPSATQSVPRGLIARWSERWRYPALLTLDATTPEGSELDAVAAADAIARGLAHPVVTPDQTARSLLEAGEFTAVRGVPNWSDPDGATVSAIAEAKARLGRRLDQLGRRAARVGHNGALTSKELEKLVERRAPDAEAELDRWRTELDTAERQWRDDLADRLNVAMEDNWERTDSESSDPAREGWRRAVQNCLDHGELAAAERLLTAGPSPDPAGGPSTVPSRRAWPWADSPLGEILTWYDGSAATRPEFDTRWRPRTESGTALVRALHELFHGPSEEWVRSFAKALDTHLGADAARHPVKAKGRGFETRLSGVADYQRIPQLALPRSLRLYVGPDSWAPTEPGPAAWLVLQTQASAEQLAQRPPGVAVLDARTVLQLAASDAQDDATRRSHRAVHLLRAIGRGLRVVDVVGQEPPDDPQGPTAHPHEEREDVAWWLDLLGVGYSETMVDALLYDTSGHPLALRAALAGLLPDDNRPAELTLVTLDEWRADAVAQTAFRDAVVAAAFLGTDREAAAVLWAVLLLVRDDPNTQLSVDDVELVVESAAEVPRSEDGRLPVEFEAALSRVVAAGFLNEEQEADARRYRWHGPGLAALLGGPDPFVLEARLAKDLWDLADRQVRSDRNAELELLAVRDSYGHKLTNDLTGMAGQVERLVRAGRDGEDLSEQLRGLQQSLASARETERRTRDRTALLKDLRPEAIDLGIELKRCRNGVFNDAPAHVEVDLDVEADDRVVVWGSGPQLRIAVGNLLDNALREVQDRPDGRIRITLGLVRRGADGAMKSVARIDIEDNGAGIPAEYLPGLNNRADWSAGPVVPHPRGSGRGVQDTRGFIERHNGTLEFLPGSEELGGAHARIELPVSAVGTP